ncbi:MAG: DNA topoisomerase IB, partial [Ferruginibacter sp.]|nr:DNA topoisomerase IB [Ferruginibacter sp.]
MEIMELAPITHNQHVKLVNDYEATASAAHLVYVSDKDPGISREKKKNGFAYFLGKKAVKDVDEITRIQKLVIPPAWDRVWICTKPNGHIQATGFDVRGRKQYRYHPLWNLLRNETKFHKLLEFS